MLQVEILSGGAVTEQLEIDGNQVYSESGKMPEFMIASVGRLRGNSLEERVQRFIDGVGNQVSLEKGNGARIFEGKGAFVSHAPETVEKTEAEPELEAEKSRRSHHKKKAEAEQVVPEHEIETI